MDYKKMEDNGTIDYYIDLTKWINFFVNRNYPLSQEDISSMAKDTSTDNLRKRDETKKILEAAMKEALEGVAEKNAQIINNANKGIYTSYSMEDYKRDIFEIQQVMLGKLWKAQHPEAQMQDEEEKHYLEEQADRAEEQEEQEGQVHEQQSENTHEEQTGEQLVKEVVEQSKDIGIRAEEISEANREIKEVENNYIQQQQQPQQDMGMSIGE